MEETDGNVFISSIRVYMEYSHRQTPHQPQQSHPQQKQFRDWICDTCQCHNFGHRDKCFQCGLPRTAAAQEVVSDGPHSEDHGNNPSVELIVRNLHPLTTDDKVQT
jgi:hypothetical protein